MRFAGKGVLVTGSNSGIGKATALLMAKEGASVLIHGRDLKTLEQTVKECKDIGAPTAKFPMVQGDFNSDNTLVQRLYDTAMAELGRIDILVNNACVLELCTFITATEEQFEKQINVALKVPIFLSQKCFPELKKNGGNIVNVSSIAGVRPSSRGSAMYPIAKAGLNHFTQCAGIEYGSEGVRVNAVCPGVTDTDLFIKSGIAETKEEQDALYKRTIPCFPVKKFGTPDETAKLIAYLASDDASMMNGALVVQDGGRTLIGLDTKTIENAAKCST